MFTYRGGLYNSDDLLKVFFNEGDVEDYDEECFNKLSSLLDTYISEGINNSFFSMINKYNGYKKHDIDYIKEILEDMDLISEYNDYTSTFTTNDEYKTLFSNLLKYEIIYLLDDLVASKALDELLKDNNFFEKLLTKRKYFDCAVRFFSVPLNTKICESDDELSGYIVTTSQFINKNYKENLKGEKSFILSFFDSIYKDEQSALFFEILYIKHYDTCNRFFSYFIKDDDFDNTFKKLGKKFNHIVNENSKSYKKQVKLDEKNKREMDKHKF